MFRRTIVFLRLALALCTAWLLPLPAHAARLAEPCLLVTDARASPEVLLADRRQFDCGRSQIGVDGPVVWALFDGLNVRAETLDPLELRHVSTQAKRQDIYVRYTDGSIIMAPSDRRTARRPFLLNISAFVLPARHGTIDALLVRAEGLQSQRGIAPAPRLVSRIEAQPDDMRALLLCGILAGVVFALLVYNVWLYWFLRYRFILFYCLSTVLMIVVGAGWSGAIFLILPDFDTTDQISLVLLGIPMLALTVALFMMSFIDVRRAWRPAIVFTLASAGIAIAASVLRIVDITFAWRLVDQLTYGGIIAAMLGIVVTTASAWRRGDRAARNYLVAWALPIALSMTRAFWALGFIAGESTIAESSPLIIMALEAMMSALAVAWNVGQTRHERDEARALHDELRYIAETDPLTSLLNRRAFIARAIGQGDALQRLILIDIDQFKRVNDRHGHQAGDEVLIAVSAMLREAAPADAVIGRLGGEEFAVLIAAQPADVLADRLRRAVANATSPGGIVVTISAGVADGHINDDADWRSLYYAADQALYRSKNGGRNRVSHAPRPLAA